MDGLPARGAGVSAVAHDGAFRHEALLYAGDEEFLRGTGSFIDEAVAAEEPTLVVVSAARIAMLRDRLGTDADRVQFADMAEVGTNPARIIPAWTDFVAMNAGSGGRLRGIGEPIWKGRTAPELAESQRHEALLNVAFRGAESLWLLCPYDVEQLDAAVIEEAHRSHPFVGAADQHRLSPSYDDGAVADTHLHTPLPDPGGTPLALPFDAGCLPAVRRLVARQAARAGFAPERIADVVFAVNEVANNSLQHGGGVGQLLVWSDRDALVCEVRDRGHLGHPLADRTRPRPDIDAKRGLWLANQLCDLVQLRSFAGGSVVRVHLSSPA
jgi:anti-sigma regulatory factor (Ser/Thr protein kinase)